MYYVQMFLNSQCIFLILMTLILTGLGVRSSFILMFDIIFYSASTLINALSGLQHRGELIYGRCPEPFPKKNSRISEGIWIIIHLMGQVVPFMFYSYYTIFSLDLFVPMQGRSDPEMNPDLLIAVILSGLALLLGGLLLPVLNLFKPAFYIMCGFLVIFIAFIICMATPLGFPYKPAVSAERFWIFVRNYLTTLVRKRSYFFVHSQHTERSFHNFGGNLRKHDSVYYILSMDRHTDDYVSGKVPTAKQILSKYKILFTELPMATRTFNDCPFELLCGAPLYSTRMFSQS